MLGEDHSLTNDFPQHLNTIAELNKNDTEFAKKADKYDKLDKEIRTLELKDAPISDEQMNQLKHERSELKDWLYERLQQE
ncbi:YdcH family protein [uncultured Pseudoalteromonas sp.]|uniref:YdcH family protein n=1 Tax=uncultured Pseudoalteromonas sp. TaxID=114053 RepID=UPI0030C8C599